MALEQSAQEVLRAREERIAYGATEAPLIAPVQDKDIHLVQDARERGFLIDGIGTYPRFNSNNAPTSPN